MKKTCDGCKAYVRNARFEYCSKHYETYLQEMQMKDLYILSPAEPCPKPRTYMALINTPEKGGMKVTETGYFRAVIDKKDEQIEHLEEEVALKDEELNCVTTDFNTFKSKAKEVVTKFFKHIPRNELITYMGEHNVIKAETFLMEEYHGKESNSNK